MSVSAGIEKTRGDKASDYDMSIDQRQFESPAILSAFRSAAVFSENGASCVAGRRFRLEPGCAGIRPASSLGGVGLMLSYEDLLREAESAGFHPDPLEKALRQIRADLAPKRFEVRGWSDNLVSECRKWLGMLMPLARSETEFLTLLNEQGEIVPELLTEDVKMQSLIRAIVLLFVLIELKISTARRESSKNRCSWFAPNRAISLADSALLNRFRRSCLWPNDIFALYP